MGYVLRMNKFYITLDDYEQNLYQYVNDGEKESYRKVRSLEKELTDILECLNEKPVSAEYRRDVNDLKNQVEGYLKENEEIFVLMNNVIADNSDVEGLKNVIHKKEISNHSYQLLVNQFKDHYLGLLNSVNDEQTRLNCQLIFLGTFLSIVVCLLIVLANKETRAITVRVSNPLQILTEASRKIKEGYLEEFHKVVIEEPTYEEVSSLVDVFNKMVIQVRDHIRLVEENARNIQTLHEKEIENMKITNMLKSSELKALQMQMNPHFLFNTLNMISRTAQMDNMEQTILLLQKTSQLLRYNLDYSGRTVPLAVEIEMLGNYVYLQEQRFRTRICFEFDLDERFHSILIPCFILQPLVENAIIHGINDSFLVNEGKEKRRKKGKITIRTCYFPESGIGEIDIEDNGAGMSEQERAKVLERLDSEKDQREKIGIANVHMRLKLIFGENYQMKIKSELGKGTQIAILIHIDSAKMGISQQKIQTACEQEIPV